jgi:hypothetical protein
MSKWMPAGLGAEPKKVMFLIALLALAPVAYWYGNQSDTPAASAPAASVPRPAIPNIDPTRVTTARPVNRGKQSRNARGGTDDFRPTLNLPDDFDLSKVDPTLRTDLLAKVREVGEAGGSRSLFEFFTPPPPPPPKVDPIKPTTPVKPTVAESKPAPSVTPPKQAVAPIPLKYFGYEGAPRAGRKLRALFVEGEDNFVAGENDMIRNRYRVVRIGTTSAEVEDTTTKSVQTLRIIDRSDP